MNKVILLGRLTADPELRATQSGKSVATFTVACDRKYKQDGQPTADFLRCIAWEKTAEIICKWFSKGQRIAIEGRIQTRSYEKNGDKKHAVEVIVETFDFCEKNSQKDEFNDPDFFKMDGDDDTPF